VIRYVEPTEQLVVKIFARNLICSMAFYRQLGFELLAHRGSFVELAWEGHRLFLDERRDVPAAAELPQANIRIMIPDVDAYWKRAQAMGATVLSALADRDYGLRDFTILDPDRLGIRFGTRLAPGGSSHA